MAHALPTSSHPDLWEACRSRKAWNMTNVDNVPNREPTRTNLGIVEPKLPPQVALIVPRHHGRRSRGSSTSVEAKYQTAVYSSWPGPRQCLRLHSCILYQKTYEETKPENRNEAEVSNIKINTDSLTCGNHPGQSSSPGRVQNCILETLTLHRIHSGYASLLRHLLWHCPTTNPNKDAFKYQATFMVQNSQELTYCDAFLCRITLSKSFCCRIRAVAEEVSSWRSGVDPCIGPSVKASCSKDDCIRATASKGKRRKERTHWRRNRPRILPLWTPDHGKGDVVAQHCWTICWTNNWDF